jgi:hypothetical protein
MFGVAGFLDFVVQYSKKLKNTTFQKLDLFLSPDEGKRHRLCRIFVRD